MGKIHIGVCSFATHEVLSKIESSESVRWHKCLGIKLRCIWLLIQIFVLCCLRLREIFLHDYDFVCLFSWYSVDL